MAGIILRREANDGYSLRLRARFSSFIEVARFLSLMRAMSHEETPRKYGREVCSIGKEIQ
jgi:hypothetical protein